MEKRIIRTIPLILFIFISICNSVKADTYTFNYQDGVINNGNGTNSPNIVSVITNTNLYPSYNSVNNTVSAMQIVDYCLVSANSGGCVSGASNYNGNMSMSFSVSALKMVGGDNSVINLQSYPFTANVGYGGSFTWSQMPVPPAAVATPNFYHITSVISNLTLQTGQAPLTQYHSLNSGDISTNGPQFTVTNNGNTSNTTPKIFVR